MSTTQVWEDLLAKENVFDFADVLSDASVAVQSQYAHAPCFTNLASLMLKQGDVSDDGMNLLSSVADPNTAEGKFLDWWGARIGVDRYLKVNGEYVRFDDDYFRFLLFYRAACNIADATADTTNKLLETLTDETVFVVDYQDMSISSVVIIGAIDEVQSTVLAQYGLLNRPAGVLANYLVIYPDEQIFGFEGSDLEPFDQGVFNPGRTIPIY